MKKLSNNMKAIIGIIGFVIFALIIIGIKNLNGPINPLKDVTTIKVEKTTDWYGNTENNYEFNDASMDKINKNVMLAVARKNIQKQEMLFLILKVILKMDFLKVLAIVWKIMIL